MPGGEGLPSRAGARRGTSWNGAPRLRIASLTARDARLRVSRGTVARRRGARRGRAETPMPALPRGRAGPRRRVAPSDGRRNHAADARRIASVPPALHMTRRAMRGSNHHVPNKRPFWASCAERGRCAPLTPMTRFCQSNATLARARRLANPVQKPRRNVQDRAVCAPRARRGAPLAAPSARTPGLNTQI